MKCTSNYRCLALATFNSYLPEALCNTVKQHHLPRWKPYDGFSLILKMKVGFQWILQQCLLFLLLQSSEFLRPLMSKGAEMEFTRNCQGKRKRAWKCKSLYVLNWHDIIFRVARCIYFPKQIENDIVLLVIIMSIARSLKTLPHKMHWT